LTSVETPPKKRPGRLRRWLLRPLGWGIATVAVLIFLLQLFLDTRHARNWIRETLEEVLTERLEREVTIGEIEFQLLPLEVQIWDGTVGGLEPDDPAFLEIPWGAVDASLFALQHRDVRLRRIRVERPVIRFQYFESGRHNVLDFRRKNSRPRRWDYFIDRLEVEKALIVLDQERIELSLSGDALRGEFRGLGEMHLEGRAMAQRIEVRLRDAEPQAVSLAATLGFTRGRFELLEAQISNSELDALGSGYCVWTPGQRAGRKCSFELEGETRGSLLSSLGYFRDLEGPVAFDGTLDWRPDAVGWRSRMRSPELLAWNRRLRELEGVLSADRYGLRFELEKARYAGGTLSGEIGYEAREDGQPIDVDLDFDGLELDALLEDQEIPVEGLGARLGGRLRYRFDRLEPRRGDGQGEIALEPDPEKGLPLSGAFPVRIDAGVVVTESLAARSARQSLLAGGFYDLERQRGLYDYEIASADVVELSELFPFTPDYRREALWLPRAGEGELEGTLYLEPGTSSADVRFDLEKVRTLSLDVPRASGSLHAATDAVETLQMTLGGEGEALLVTGRVPYDLETDERGLDLVVNSSGWPIASLRAWMPFQIPLDGAVSGRLDLHMDAAGHHGRMRATASPATFAGLPLDALEAQLDWSDQSVRVGRLAAEAEAGRLAGGGTLDWATGALELHLESPSLELGGRPLDRYLPRPDLSGLATVTLQVAGTLEKPRLDLEIGVPRLALGGERLPTGASRLALDWDGERLNAHGRLLDAVSFQGGGRLDRERADLSFVLAATDLAELVSLAFEEPPARVAGSFNGRLSVSGELGGESSPTVELELGRLQLELLERQLENLEPVRLILDEQAAVLESLYLGEAATGTEIFLGGEVGYGPGTPLDLRLQSSLDASWLQVRFPDLQVEGKFDLLARVGGTLEAPYLDGQGELRPSRAMMPSRFPHSLEALEGLFLFYPDQVVIDHLRADLAGGRIDAAGELVLPRGETPADYRLQVQGRGLRLRYPEGWAVYGDTELSITSVEEGTRVAGRADLDEIQYLQDVPVGFEQILEGFFQRQRLEVDEADEMLSAVLLNIDVSAPGALAVRNNLAQLRGSADLSVRGTLARPVIYGAVEVDPGGQLTYGSTDYEVERGRLNFTDPYSIAPEIDLVATTRVRDFEITLTLAGSLDRMEASFASEPPLPAHEVFQVLATGSDENVGPAVARRQEELGSEQSMSAATFLYGQAASVIGDRVSNLFGLDKFRIDPLTGSGDDLSTARVTVGKRVSKDLFITYSVDPSSTEEQRLRVEWQVSDGFLVVLTQNGDNTYSADARWERSF